MRTLELLAQEKTPEIRNHKLCAAVVHKHREIISIGYPKRKTHPLQAQFAKNTHAVYLHAETDALIKAIRIGYKFDQRHTSVYVARVKQISSSVKEFIKGDSTPCTGCMSLIEHLGIVKVHWTGLDT